MPVVPERQMRAPLHLHQRAYIRFGQNRLDARDQRGRLLAFGLPVDVVEHHRAREYTQIGISFAVDQRIQALRAARDILVFRRAQ